MTNLRRQPLETGMFDMPQGEYRRLNAVNRSLLEILHNGSPAHVKTYMESPFEPTPAMELGSAIHTACLEPQHFEKQVAAVKARSAQARKDHLGKVLILEREMEIVEGIKSALSNSSITWDDNEKLTPQEIITRSLVEKTMIWRDPVSNVLCKARPDLIFENSLIDFKTTSSIKEFSRQAYNLGYHRQAAFYVQGYTMATGNLTCDFYFLVVEKEAPYGLQLFKCTPDFIRKGSNEIRVCLDVLAACLQTGVWPSYSGAVQELNLPGWVK